MEDLGSKINLSDTVCKLSDLMTEMKELNFAVNVLHSEVTCLGEEGT